MGPQGTDMSGKIALVTGGGRNVGKAVAFELARNGASIALADHDSESIAEVAKEIAEEAHVDVVPLTCDVGNTTDVQQAVRAVVDRFGHIDVLVNNVAVSDHSTILELDESEWDHVLRVSLTGSFLCAKYVAREMVAAGRGGVIVNIGSTSGLRGRAGATAYPAAKAGLHNLTRVLAIQLGPYHVRVNTVIPNQVGSPVGQADVPDAPTRVVSNLLGRPARPEDIAAVVAFVCSGGASFVTGSELLVDGGSMIAREVD